MARATRLLDSKFLIGLDLDLTRLLLRLLFNERHLLSPSSERQDDEDDGLPAPGRRKWDHVAYESTHHLVHLGQRLFLAQSSGCHGDVWVNVSSETSSVVGVYGNA